MRDAFLAWAWVEDMPTSLIGTDDSEKNKNSF